MQVEHVCRNLIDIDFPYLPMVLAYHFNKRLEFGPLHTNTVELFVQPAKSVIFRR